MDDPLLELVAIYAQASMDMPHSLFPHIPCSRTLSKKNGFRVCSGEKHVSFSSALQFKLSVSGFPDGLGKCRFPALQAGSFLASLAVVCFMFAVWDLGSVGMKPRIPLPRSVSQDLTSLLLP